MTPSVELSDDQAAALEHALPGLLAEYAERLLLSTGLSAQDALRIASGRSQPPAGLESLARALVRRLAV